MEHGSSTGLKAIRPNQRTDYDLLYVRCLVALHLGHSRHDGRLVGIPAHIASSLGRIHEQVLRRPWLRFPTFLIQNHPGRG